MGDTAASPMRVLVLEDDLGDRALLESGAPRGLVLFTFCGRLSELKDLYKPAKFDAVLADLNVPDSTDQLETACQVKAITECPVIALTGLEDSEAARRAMLSGIQGYLVKGKHAPSELIAMLQMSITLWKKSLLQNVPLPPVPLQTTHQASEQAPQQGPDLFRRAFGVVALGIAFALAVAWNRTHKLTTKHRAEKARCEAKLRECESRQFRR